MCVCVCVCVTIAIFLFLSGETAIQISITGERSIQDVIENWNPKLQNHITIQTDFLSYLIKYKVLTKEEQQYLEPNFPVTESVKIRKLLSCLDSKSDEGQKNFVRALYESSKKPGYTGHVAIIELFKSEGILIDEVILEG